MALMVKIRELCNFNGTSITALETKLGYPHGSIIRKNADTLQPDKIRAIAKYFNVTPTYLMTEMVYCVCPTCGVAYDPLDKMTIESHEMLHTNFVNLRDKVGYLLNTTQVESKRVIAESFLEDPNIPVEGKVFHYETIVQCDFAEYASSNNFVVDMSYSDFIKDEIREKKYFDLIPESVIKNLTVKYNVDPNDNNVPLIDLFQTDKEFMTNITDLWDLPKQLRYDVYKAIRHAKRDYADKEYYTNPYASTVTTCYDYDENNDKCQKCEKGEKK